MKRLKLIFFLLLSMSVIGQDDLVTARMTDYQVLYRGYPNKVIFSTNERPLCAECDTVYPTGELNEYIVIPGVGRTKTISFSNGQEISLRVSRLPDPTLFYGSAPNRGKVRRVSSMLRATYGPEMNLWGKFEVISWTVSIGLETFKGEGYKISDEVKAYFGSVKSNGCFSVIAKIKGPDGIVRSLAGGFSY
ncbi:MAG: hypothetical protein ACJA0U_001655 [Salibacteraceae bacterium]|jgi:hypothetical protein